ncbi:penicillin-binding protein activator [Maribrevibacterium harenarium]|uniref:Penicillin-binding protein activator n=1 Tax=Maribrevibacterium harenarium TaxID=2589817 RepID=A0A501WZ67_9GAMM|nr:penicillin-binding protein activator [Maribrevibacterium harenarium]TPE52331.1 penicillin-binding protein activator [Maribrevibacterium harenarium]
MWLSRILTLSTLVVALVGCGSVELNMPEPAQVQQSETNPVPSDPLQYQVWLAEQQASKTSAAPYYYNAAIIAKQDQEFTVAQDILEQHVVDISFARQYDANLLLSEVYLKQEQPLRALGRLSYARGLAGFRQPQNQIRYYQQRIPVLETLGSWTNVAKDRVRLSLLLPIEARQENQEQLWQALQNLTDNELAALENYPLELLPGWVAVNKMLRRADQTIDQQLASYEEWTRTNPLHPAAQTAPLDFQVMADLESFKPKTIIVMLPLSKELSAASEAILDGIIGRYFAGIGDRPKLHVIDTDGYTTFDEVMTQAFTFNADVMVGPLRKQNVAQLMRYQLDRPVIALNQLDNSTAQENLYHFSLNPIDEIDELLTFAKREGARSGAVLTLQSTWALRQGDQFVDEAQQLGMPVLAHLSYEDTPLGRQQAVKKLLLVDESEERIKSIKQWLGTPDLEASSRARNDLDFVFYAGKLDNAKQIRPMLDFYFANKITMVATSSLHDAPPNNISKVEDIERIVFTEIPELVKKSGSQPNYTLARLSALGTDSYLLATRLHLFKKVQHAKLSSQTGVLSLNDNQTFSRRPNIVTYRNGVLQDATNDNFYTETN